MGWNVILHQEFDDICYRLTRIQLRTYVFKVKLS